jgi:hypothetical protein
MYKDHIYVQFKMNDALNVHDFLDWINPSKINWARLSLNPNAIHLLEHGVNCLKIRQFSRK